MQLFFLDEHELKHNLLLQREAQKSYNMTPRGIRNTLQCNPHHFPSAFSTDFPTVLFNSFQLLFCMCCTCMLREAFKEKKEQVQVMWKAGETKANKT